MCAVAGWSRVVCLKGCDIKVLWSLPTLSSTTSPFIYEAHFISLPPHPHFLLLVYILCSSTDATCFLSHTFFSPFVLLSSQPLLERPDMRLWLYAALKSACHLCSTFKIVLICRLIRISVLQKCPCYIESWYFLIIQQISIDFIDIVYTVYDRPTQNGKGFDLQIVEPLSIN